MKKKTLSISILAGMAMSTVAAAQFAPGTILFTSNGVGSTAPGVIDGIYRVAPQANANVFLVRDVFPNDDISTPETGPIPSTALVDIVAGPNGSFFFVDQGQQPIAAGIPVGAGPSPSRLYRVDDLFGAAPITVQYESVNPSDPNVPEVQRPIGVVYSERINRVINVNNPTSFSVPFAGLLAHNPETPGVAPQFIFEEVDLDFGTNPPGGLPSWQNGTRIIEITEADVPTFYSISLDGGTRVPGQNATVTRPGTLTMFTLDPVTLEATETTLVDFGAQGFDTEINLLRGLDRDTQGRVFVSDARTQAVYMITDPEGAPTLTQVLSQSDFANLVNPSALEFNPFTGLFVLAIDGMFDGDGNAIVEPRIVQFHPDDPAGTLETIAVGFAVGGFEFIPAPSSAAVLALAGLFATRRRRA
jgi:hypothetical protein